MIGFRGKAGHPGEIQLKGHPGLSDDYTELARFWVSGEQGRSYVLTALEQQWSPELLGALLVEGVQTAAVAFAARDGITEQEALQRIWGGFDDERAALESDSSEEMH
jgi:hypothetical protein